MTLPPGRSIDSIETLVDGMFYRSRTEARWAIFFAVLDVTFIYEGGRINLSSGESYLPDFYLPEFDAYFEVKAANDAIVSAECVRARTLAADRPGQRVWLAAGAPSFEPPNILTLEQWHVEVPIATILSDPENRYCFLQDRRDEGVYWLQANAVGGGFRRTFMVGGPGVVTTHDRVPLMLPHIEAAYAAAAAARWE
ncbi:hypothetical protein [Jiella pacifica]|uniref:Uncharacterized protein n=1 Tax=Jiella pacifica TaxID=2696469 RepID=A0A6N9T2I0_9HYPH|nr:hypothetical protein [Jiella pacifica]NDW05557.1 hypothetical protein [Jiella pacifica]